MSHRPNILNSLSARWRAGRPAHERQTQAEQQQQMTLLHIGGWQFVPADDGFNLVLRYRNAAGLRTVMVVLLAMVMFVIWRCLASFVPALCRPIIEWRIPAGAEWFTFGMLAFIIASIGVVIWRFRSACVGVFLGRRTLHFRYEGPLASSHLIVGAPTELRIALAGANAFVHAVQGGRVIEIACFGHTFPAEQLMTDLRQRCPSWTSPSPPYPSWSPNSLPASEPSHPSRAAGLGLFAVVWLVLGVVGVVLGCSKYLAYRATDSWTPTPAVLLNAKVEIYGENTESPDGTCRVEYAYTVAGREYKGNTLSAVPEAMRDYEAQAQYRSLAPRVNGPVTVFVDPHDASHSALFRTASSPWFAMFLGSFASFATAAWIATMAIRSGRRIQIVPPLLPKGAPFAAPIPVTPHSPRYPAAPRWRKGR